MRSRRNYRTKSPVRAVAVSACLVAAGHGMAAPATSPPQSESAEPRWIEGWPVEIEGEDGTFTVYQPQLDAATRDGSVYRRSSGGSWERSTGRGGWTTVDRPARSQQLSREFQSRSNGTVRVNNLRSERGTLGGRRRR